MNLISISNKANFHYFFLNCRLANLDCKLLILTFETQPIDNFYFLTILKLQNKYQIVGHSVSVVALLQFTSLWPGKSLN